MPGPNCARRTSESAIADAIFPQIAIAIGVLTSKKGGGWRTTLADWTWHQAGAIVGCHCSVLWLGGRVTTNFRGVDVVPLLGAIVVCYGGGRGVVCYGWGGRWRPTLGEWTWCHCWVPLQAAIVVCWRGGWRPTLGEWTFHCRVPMAPYTAMASRKSIQKSCLELLADVTLFSTLMTQKLFFAIWGLCWYNFVFKQYLSHLIHESTQMLNSWYRIHSFYENPSFAKLHHNTWWTTSWRERP